MLIVKISILANKFCYSFTLKINIDAEIFACKVTTRIGGWVACLLAGPWQRENRKSLSLQEAAI